MWARMAKAALGASGADATFYDQNWPPRYYMARQLPATKMHLARIESGAERSWRWRLQISDGRLRLTTVPSGDDE